MAALPVLGHEFWIEPRKFQVESGEPVVADLMNGEEFSGSELAYFDHRSVRFEAILGEVVMPYAGRMGDIPAMHLAGQPDGLLVIAHQTEPSSLKYKDWKRFQAFADHKDIPDIKARHAARGLLEADFYESYTRYAKSLIGVGDANGRDRRVGFEIELVAGTNPYGHVPDNELPVTLFYQDAAKPDTQIEIFARAASGDVTLTLTRTDAAGTALIPLRPGHDYLLNAVALRPAPHESEAVWETHWASLTFRHP